MLNISEKSTLNQEEYLKILSIIAHNVKGPVKYMQYVTDYTISHWAKMEPKNLLDCANAINTSSRRISEQLVNIMNWARIQDGSFNPDKRKFNINHSIKDELKLHKAFLKIKKIKIEKDFSPKLTVSSDENIFHLAFHNIIANAIKFSTRDSKIIVSTKLINNQVLVTVQDFGVGMNPEELSLIYNNKSFSNPGTVEEQGSGFGLKIAKDLISLLGGDIEIDSEKDKGTTVTLCLPA